MIMSYEKKFRSDLKDGELGEDLVAEFLIGKGYKVLERRKDNWWDIKVERIGIETTLEIKTDRWEKFNRITGNMFIEVSCSGKDSGIMVTKADYFIYFYPEWELIYIIKCDKLKELLKERPDLFWRNGSGGDGGRVVAYVCSRHDVKDYFKIVKIKKSIKWNE
jgi:hypothetical protein